MKHYILLIPLFFVGYHLPVSGEPHRQLHEYINELKQMERQVYAFLDKETAEAKRLIREFEKLKRENERLKREIEAVTNGRSSHGRSHWDDTSNRQ